MKFEDDSNYAEIRKKNIVPYKNYTLVKDREEITVQRITTILREFLILGDKDGT
jgi:hypothetical protein